MEKSSQKLDAKNIAFKSIVDCLEKMAYQYVKDLGAGKFGNVLEMLRPNDKYRAAVKLIREKDLCEAEMFAWPSLCQKNILFLLSFNYISQTNTFAFITQKCETSLHKKLGGVEYIFDVTAFDKAISWIKDTITGIAYLHENKFAHLDIKADNVLILVNGRAVVTNFGLISSSQVLISKYVSPIPHRPPETYAEDGSWVPMDDEMYDTWTVGLKRLRVFTGENFYQVLQDYKDFWAEKMYSVLYDILQKKNFSAKMKVSFPRSQSCLSKVYNVLNLIKACLHLDPKKRVTMKQALGQRMFGGPLYFELEQRCPWNERVDTEQIESLLHGLKIRQTEKSLDNGTVKEKKAGAEDEVLFLKKVGGEEKVESNKKVEENICEDGDRVIPKEIVANSTTKVKKNERSEREQKNVSDDLEKDAAVRNRHAVEEKPVRKTDGKARVQVILSAHALVTDIDNQG